MFAGHVGAALAIGRAERRVNVGVLVFAAVLLDVALWVLVLLGLETVTIPANFAVTHQPEFVFPYSHGLLASIGWSALAGAATLFWYPRLERGRTRAAVLVAAAVFSHWILDALVHASEMPLAGAHSIKVGLGLWNAMPMALALEAAVALVGLWLFLPGANLSRPRKVLLAALSFVVLAFTVAGMTLAPAPPSAAAMAATSIVTIMAVCLPAFWIGRPASDNGSRV